MSLADIADLMGHKDLATTQIYAKVEQEHLRSIIDKLTPLVPPQVSPESVTCPDLEEREESKLLIPEKVLEHREKVAERVGFEPTLEFPLNTLSKRAPSATRPSLRRPDGCTLDFTSAPSGSIRPSRFRKLRTESFYSSSPNCCAR